MAWNPTNAIHLVSSESAAGHVKQATAELGVSRHVRILGDRPTLGPCDVDPKRHIEMRRAWNAGDPGGIGHACGIDDLRAAVADDLPVIVWASRAYEDLVWLWWILDGLARIGPFVQSPTIVRPDSQIESVGGMSPEAGRAALDVAHPVDDDELQEGSRLWRLFASPDPRPFDDARRSGSMVFPELHESAELHGAWFPRLESGRLKLAENDELLLGGLADAWLTPGRIRVRPWPFHGFDHVRRLREWAAHGAVEREDRDPDNDNPFEQDVFRLTDRTRALLAHGLNSVDDAPPLYIGGCKLNDSASPWVRVMDDAGWRIYLMDCMS